METIIGTIASLIAAVAAVATLWVTIINSKGNIISRIDKKENEIQAIENLLVRKYGINRGVGWGIDPLDLKKEKLQSQINHLRRKL